MGIFGFHNQILMFCVLGIQKIKKTDGHFNVHVTYVLMWACTFKKCVSGWRMLASKSFNIPRSSSATWNTNKNISINGALNGAKLGYFFWWFLWYHHFLLPPPFLFFLPHHFGVFSIFSRTDLWKSINWMECRLW